MNPVVFLGVGGLVAWLLAKDKKPGVSPGVVSPPVSIVPNNQDAFIKYVLGDVQDGEVDFFLDYGKGVPGGPKDRHTPASESFKAALGSRRDMRKTLFMRQVWGPASRFPISALTQDDMERANAFLAGGLARTISPECVTQGQLAEVEVWARDSAQVQSASDIGATVGNLVSSAMGGSGSSGSAGAGLINWKADVEREIKKIFYDVPTPLSRDKALDFFPENVYTQFDQYGNPINSADDARIFSGVGDMNALAEWEGEHPTGFTFGFIDMRAPWEFYTDPINYRFTTVYARMGLFSPGEHGAWRYPWISDQLAARDTLRRRVYERARLYRALDLIGAQEFPFSDKGFGKEDAHAQFGYELTEVAHAGTYIYNVKKYGRIKGSIFPPVDVDRELTNIDLVAGHVGDSVEVKKPTDVGLVAVNVAGPPYVPPAQTIEAPPAVINTRVEAPAIAPPVADPLPEYHNPYIPAQIATAPTPLAPATVIAPPPPVPTATVSSPPPSPVTSSLVTGTVAAPSVRTHLFSRYG